jgi:hypothetical protein
MIYHSKKLNMKKLKLVVLVMFISLTTFAKEPNVLDGIKEAAKGVAWMVKLEICKASYVIWGWAGYHCTHNEHCQALQSLEK